MTEENFPRGGKRPDIKKPSNLLFYEKDKSTKKHKTRIKKEVNLTDQDTNLIADTAERLSDVTLFQGMIILCRISYTADYKLTISMPGGNVGSLNIGEVSHAYSDHLLDLLEKHQMEMDELKLFPELYKSGDYVVCCVKKITTGKNWTYNLSLKPHLINENLRNNYLTKDTKVICAIESTEEHGYVIDTGIFGVTAFLPTENVDKGKKYFPGYQLMCTIKKIRVVEHTCTIEFSAKKKDVNSITHDIASIDFLTPGIRLSLRITRILSNGVQVTFGKDNIGYINRMYLDKPLSEYADNMIVTGTLLYVLPTVKFAYFTLLTNTSENKKMREGDIVEKAEVLYRESNGIVLKLSESGIRGFLSFRRTGVPFTDIKSVFKKRSMHKCRIISYNWMEQTFVCSMQHDIFKDDYVSPSDIKCGDILIVTIVDINKKHGNIHVAASGKKIRGVITRLHLSDDYPIPFKTFNIGDKIKARVLQLLPHHIVFTLKPSLLKSKLPILHDISDAKCGSKYHCTISKLTDDGMLVRFYGLLSGWIPHKMAKTHDMNWNYSVGQTITVRVESITNERMKLKIVKSKEQKKQKDVNLSLGEEVEGTITESSTKGVHLKIQKDEDIITGFLPAGHMAPCIEIGSLLASRSVPGDTISAVVFSTRPTVILSRTFASHEQYRSFDSLKVGDCLLCSIREISRVGVRVILPINDYPKYGFVSLKNISNFDLLHENQMLFVGISGINHQTRELVLSMLLTDLWRNIKEREMRMMVAVDVLNIYLGSLLKLAGDAFYKNKPISSVTLGQKVVGTVQKITEHGLVLQLENNLMATVRKDHYSGDPQIGDAVRGTILWKDHIHEIVEVSLIPRIANSISSKQRTLAELPTEIALKGEILMITKWFILVLIRRNGSGYLAALPVRRHANDILPDLTPYTIRAKIRVYVIMKESESNIIPICMLKSAFEIPRSATPVERKRKLSEQHDATLAVPKKKRKIKNGLNKIKIGIKESEIEKNKVNHSAESNKDYSADESEIEEQSIAKGSHVPECKFFWDNEVDSTVVDHAETSNDDEETPEVETKQKKKKVNPAERREEERQREREIRQREEALASNEIPNSIDQFDRLVASSPDSSLVWLQYMAYHLQATEVDKARLVARRAIKTINFREEKERLNVWNAWLNLESTFGTPLSLNDVFQEALRNNDDFKIYKHMLKLYTDAGKTCELEKLIARMIDKFKRDPQMWVECGAALLKVNMTNKSRNIMQRALDFLPASQHVNLVVKFANLENKLGDKERAVALFENILTTYPKRVDVWSCYVDCIIKSGNIGLARTVLKRGCVQTLPARKMKTLFTKFINFEEKYGTPETVAEVRKMASDYVERKCNKEQE